MDRRRALRLAPPLLLALTGCGGRYRHDLRQDADGGADSGGSRAVASGGTAAGATPTAGSGGVAGQPRPPGSVDPSGLVILGVVPSCGNLMLEAHAEQLYVLSTSGTLQSFSLPSAEVVKAVTSDVAGARAFAIGVDGNAYVVHGNLVTSFGPDGGAGLRTGSVDQVWDIAVDRGSVYWAHGNVVDHFYMTRGADLPKVVVQADAGSQLMGVVASGDNLVYASSETLDVQRTSLTSNRHVDVARSQRQLVFGHRSLQTDGSYVYWSNGALRRASLGSEDLSLSNVATPIGGHAVRAFAIDADAQEAYIGTDDGRLEKSNFAAGDAEALSLADHLEPVTSVVLDDRHVYVASGCKVLRGDR